MSLIEIRWNADRRFLRQFGLALLAFVGLVGLLHGLREGDFTGAFWLWGVGAAVVGAGFLCPPLLRSIYVGWMLAIYPVAWLVSLVVLAIVFYGVMTPVGILLRIRGYDPLQRRFEPNAETYWVPRPADEDPGRYLRQY